MVVEVDRPNRQKRRKQGKSDPTDAVAAARAALSGEATVTPKTRNGPVEQIRVLMVARRSAREQRIQSLNQLRHLVFTAPEEIRVRFKDRLQDLGLVSEAANMRPRKGSDPVVFTTQCGDPEPGETGETAQCRDGQRSTGCSLSSSPRRLRHCLLSTGLEQTLQPAFYAPQGTTPTASTPKGPGLISVGLLRSQPTQAR